LSYASLRNCVHLSTLGQQAAGGRVKIPFTRTRRRRQPGRSATVFFLSLHGVPIHVSRS